MNRQTLTSITDSLLANDKGILAADESTTSANKRLASVGLPEDESTRLAYRRLLLTTPDLAKYVSGVILYDETFHQTIDETPIPTYLQSIGVIPGIKVDQGLQEMAGHAPETFTRGLDTLTERISEYAQLGAGFAKWRSLVKISDSLPSEAMIVANTHDLARYARICQEAGVVPIVEPEVLYEGTHSLERCREVMTTVFSRLTEQLTLMKVHMPGVILKTSFILPGRESGEAMDHRNVAATTLNVLEQCLPSDLGGVVFLSGGQKPYDAFANLARLHQLESNIKGLTFSYSRALQDPVLRFWANHQTDLESAQSLFETQLAQAQKALEGVMPAPDDDDFVTASQI